MVFYVLRPRHGSPLPTAQAGTSIPRIHVRRSVAVLGFRNLPGRTEDNWLSSAFCEMLNTELAAGGELRMVPGEDVARAKSELPLSDEDSLGKSTLQRLRTNPGADVVILGSYTMLPMTPSVGFVLMFVFKTRLAEKRSRRIPSRATRTTSLTWSRIWVANCGEVSVWLYPRRELKMSHEQLFRRMKRRPASTPREKQDCGHSTISRLAIY